MRKSIVQTLLLALAVSLALFSYFENEYSGVVYSSEHPVDSDYDNSFFKDGKNIFLLIVESFFFLVDLLISVKVAFC